MKENTYGTYYGAGHTVDVVSRGNLLSIRTSPGVLTCVLTHMVPYTFALLSSPSSSLIELLLGE